MNNSRVVCRALILGSLLIWGSAACSSKGSDTPAGTGGHIASSGTGGAVSGAGGAGSGGSGGACAASCPVTLASGLNEPQPIAVNATDVFWASGMNSPLNKVPIGGGATTLVAMSNGASAITMDSTSIYWSDLSGVMTVPLAGGSSTMLADTSAGSPNSLALDTTSVYWATDELAMPAIIGKVDKSGGATTTLYTAPLNYNIAYLALDGANLYWIEAVACPGTSGPLEAHAMTISTAGGTATQIAKLPAGMYLTALAVDAKNLYWGDQTDDGANPGLWMIPKTGGAPTQLVKGPAFGIALDTTTLYWTGNDSNAMGAVLKMPIAGGAAVILGSGIAPHGIAVDAMHVYWSDMGDVGGSADNGSVMQVAK